MFSFFFNCYVSLVKNTNFFFKLTSFLRTLEILILISVFLIFLKSHNLLGITFYANLDLNSICTLNFFCLFLFLYSNLLGQNNLVFMKRSNEEFNNASTSNNNNDSFIQPSPKKIKTENNDTSNKNLSTTIEGSVKIDSLLESTQDTIQDNTDIINIDPKTSQTIKLIIVDECEKLYVDVDPTERLNILKYITAQAIDFHNKGGNIKDLGLSGALKTTDFDTVQLLLVQQDYKFSDQDLREDFINTNKESNLELQDKKEQIVLVDPRGGKSGGPGIGGTSSGSGGFEPTNTSSNSFSAENFTFVLFFILDLISNLVETFISLFYF